MSRREMLVLGAFVAVVTVLLLVAARLETGLALALVVVFGANSALVLHGAHRAVIRRGPAARPRRTPPAPGPR